ncbi:MAG: hypothetical protein JWO41_102 [Candidatus Saccharibacteria bacterium]|nr:hypothetical protein [Candidatus Saccharibacteria bacterium]
MIDSLGSEHFLNRALVVTHQGQDHYVMFKMQIADEMRFRTALFSRVLFESLDQLEAQAEKARQEPWRTSMLPWQSTNAGAGFGLEQDELTEAYRAFFVARSNSVELEE